MNKDYIKVEKFINRDMADFLYGYVLLEDKRLRTLKDSLWPHQTMEEYYVYGNFEDEQALGDFSNYGDLIFDTLLLGKVKQLSRITETRLVPQYSYHRLYTNGSELVRHKDRESCEISLTLCLGYDSDDSWPIWFEDSDGKEVSVELQPGDMVIYKGCELDHWREPFKGKNHAQVFLHYNDATGKYGQQKYDGRWCLGVKK